VADQVATFGLDDKEFRRGLQSIDNASRDTASRMERAWSVSASRMGLNVLKGFGAFRAGQAMVRFATQSVRDYAKENDEVAQSLDRISSSAKEFRLSLGRDLSSLLPMLEEAAEALVAVGNGRARAVNTLVDTITGDPGRGAAKDADMQSAQEGTQLRRFEEEVGRRLRAERLRSSGDAAGERDAALMEEGHRFMREVSPLRRLLERGNLGDAMMRTVQGAIEDVGVIHARNQEAIQDRFRERFRRENEGMGDEAVERFEQERERRRRRDDAVRSLATGSTGLRTEVLRAEAEAAEGRAAELRMRGLSEQATEEG
jgi:hypothetical protein